MTLQPLWDCGHAVIDATVTTMSLFIYQITWLSGASQASKLR
jgi:hypothetical protein